MGNTADNPIEVVTWTDMPPGSVVIHQEDRTEFNNQLEALAKRLGVEPHSGGFAFLVGPYALLDLMHAFLDRIDDATGAEEAIPPD